MAEISFWDFWNSTKDVINDFDMQSSTSKNVIKESFLHSIYDCTKDKSTNKWVAVKYMGETISKSYAKHIYIGFIEKLCKNDRYYRLLQQKKCFISRQELQGGEKRGSKTVYHRINNSDTYIFCDCNIAIFMIKCVKMMAALEIWDEMKQTYFIIKQSNGPEGVASRERENKMENSDNPDLDKLSTADISASEALSYIKSYISAKGFTFDADLVENYYLSLKSKPFVILAGTSGTGKTRLVRLFAEAIGATAANGQYKLVAVRPDWSDSSDLFGHVNLDGRFIPGAILDFIKMASEHRDKPYFLCLDEMNLARVEYYLSDILSIMETRELKDGQIVTDPLLDTSFYGADAAARERYGVVSIPENLYIIGTVNMDETTFPFSRKVLDRANTIEFSTVNLEADFGQAEAEDESQDILADNAFLKPQYLFFKQCQQELDRQEFIISICSELETINQLLQKANAHVGYRVRDEIVFYLLNNEKAGLLDRNTAFDFEIMQKILPRIQGSSAFVKKMLCELFQHCAEDHSGYDVNGDDTSKQMMKAVEDGNCRYPKSAEKIAFMVRRFEEDGFTAYWL